MMHLSNLLSFIKSDLFRCVDPEVHNGEWAFTQPYFLTLRAHRRPRRAARLR